MEPTARWHRAAVALVAAALVLGVPTGASAAEGDGDAPRVTSRTFADPPASVRPGTRWWWDSLINTTGASFSLDDALEEVDAFAEAGFGRFEIAWAPSTYGTEEQQADLAAVARRAQQHGMQVDMTLGPGWPWATPETNGSLGQQELMYGRTEVTGPTTFDEDVPPAIGDDEPRGRLVAASAARVVEAGPPVTQAGTPPASSTVLDPSSLIDLTTRLDGQRLRWRVPEGDWIVFAYWQRNREGNNVSLISRRSVEAGLDYVDANQLGAAEDEVRRVGHSFFEDSLELNAEELYWTPGLPRAFEQRRGYDMTKYLPLMFAQGVSDYWVPQDEPVPDFELANGDGGRYRQDYYATITDLYLDDHVKVVGRWARKYDMQFRTQPAYGNNFDVIRSAREAARAGVLVDDESLNAGDTPFAVSVGDTVPIGTEHYSDPEHPYWRFAMDHYRQVTSGSHQGGGTEITSELGAWFGRELATSLREFKRMMDKEWAAGLTRPLLHGVTHSPEGTPWPGASHFFALVGESLNHRTWPEWSHLRRLSDYWGRGALVLQQGRAVTDVAVLRDDFVTTAAGQDVVRPFFDGEALERRGWSIGYVDSQGVAEAGVGPRGELFPAGPGYRAVVVDTDQVYVGGRRLSGVAAAALDRASARGLRVVFVGDLPQQGLSGRDPRSEDRAVRDAVRRILARPTATRVAQQSDVAGALVDLGLRPTVAWRGEHPVYSQVRRVGRSTYVYLWNATGEPQDLAVSVAATGTPRFLDLWNGSMSRAGAFSSAGGRTTVPVALPPHGTTVLALDGRVPARHVVASSADDVVAQGHGAVELRDLQGGRQQVRWSDGRRSEVVLPTVGDEPLTVGGPTNPWSLQVRTFGPEGEVDRPAMPLPVLADWRTIPGLSTESGIGTYTTTVDVPEGWVGRARGAVLDLGEFHGGVQVRVNGELVSKDLDPQAPLDVTRWLAAGSNEIEVVLATTPFNKAVVSPTTLVTRPAWPASFVHRTQPYGLLGPVTLSPYARGRVDLS